MFREAAALGAELKALGDETLGARARKEAAILFDWDNWWAIEYSAGPSVLLKYRDEIQNYYTALYEQNMATDIIGVEDDFSDYRVIIAPVLYMVKPGVDEKIKAFVQAGGIFVTTFFSGYVDDHDMVVTGGYPGKLRDLLGIWVEESDALPEGERIILHGRARGMRRSCCVICCIWREPRCLQPTRRIFMRECRCSRKNVTERERHTMWRCGRTRYFMKR